MCTILLVAVNNLNLNVRRRSGQRSTNKSSVEVDVRDLRDYHDVVLVASRREDET